MKELFEFIVKNRLWQETVCGSGSTMQYTASLRQQLPEFMIRHDINSMLDLPCGDYSWMSQVAWPPAFRYQGADITDSLVKQNQINHPSVEFTVLDICKDVLPQADLVFCRDCLFHFSNADISRALTNLAHSGIHWLLTTTYPDVTINQDISTGDFRPINLCQPPWNLPAPVDYLEDWIDGYDRRIMALWHMDVLKTRFENEVRVKQIFLDWQDVKNQTADILRKIHKDSWRPDYVVGVTRGGLIPGNLISQYLDVPMETLKVSLRDSDGNDNESNLWMAEDAFNGKQILIVDDINDTGATLDWIMRDWTSGCHPEDPRWQNIWGSSVRVAVLVDNDASHTRMPVSYYSMEVNKISDPCWIVFPWEDWWKR